MVLLPHRERLSISNVTAKVNGVEMLQFHQHRIKLERMPMYPQEEVKKEKREDEFGVHCTIKKPLNHGESPGAVEVVTAQLLLSRLTIHLILQRGCKLLQLLKGNN